MEDSESEIVGALAEVEDRLYRWEISPHPWDADYSHFVTDDDQAALQGIWHAAEMHLWDAAKVGETHILTVKLNDVPAVNALKNR